MDFSDLLKYGEYVLLFLGIASTALHGVSRVTKTKKDDEVAGKLDKLQNILRVVVGASKPKVK